VYGCVPQMVARLALAVRVWSHSFIPRTIVIMAQITTNQPCNFNHPLLVGITMAGIDRRQVKKMSIPLARRTCIGKWLISTILAAELTVGAVAISFFHSMVTTVRRIPEPRKRASATRKEMVTPDGILL